MANDESNQYLVKWGTPIAGEDACGEDCTYSPEYAALRKEVDKDTSLHATKGTDWTVVSRLGAEILTTLSKDLRVLVYVVFAEFKLNGTEAAVPAFAALNEILLKWWDSLYPSLDRLQRRLAPLTWLSARMEQSAVATNFMDGSSESVKALFHEFSKLQSFLEGQVGDSSPTFAGIASRIPASLQTPPATECVKEEDHPQPPPAQKKTSPAPSNIPSGDPDSHGLIPAGVLPQVVRNIIDHSRQLAAHYLSLDRTDARAYQLHRAALWGTLLQLPQVDASGKTQLSMSIGQDRIQEYTAGIEARRFAEVLLPLERSAAQSPFWFEGHVMVVRCLEGLEAHHAAACVRGAFSALLQRFPDLPGYKFKDNTHFASSRILPWLETLGSGQKVTRPATVPAAETSGTDSSDEESLLEKAIERSVEEGIPAGLRVLGPMSPGRTRSAVQHGILRARYCIAVRKKNAASRILTEIYLQMEQWGLLDWEPELTARVLVLLLSAQPKRDGSEEEALRRLHWLHLDTALGLDQN